jgi:hypothetical protein
VSLNYQDRTQLLRGLLCAMLKQKVGLGGVMFAGIPGSSSG